MNGAQGVLVAEKEVLLSIENFTIIKGLTLLMAVYYVFFVGYAKSTAASSFLLFVQEFLLGIKDTSARHSARYKSFVNALLREHLLHWLCFVDIHVYMHSISVEFCRYTCLTLLYRFTSNLLV